MKRKRRIPRAVYIKRRYGFTFYTAALNDDHAKTIIKAFARDMRHSAKLRIAWEISPGNIGLGSAGIIAARTAGK